MGFVFDMIVQFVFEVLALIGTSGGGASANSPARSTADCE